jgi:hypothetical protein
MHSRVSPKPYTLNPKGAAARLGRRTPCTSWAQSVCWNVTAYGVATTVYPASASRLRKSEYCIEGTQSSLAASADAHPPFPPPEGSLLTTAQHCLPSKQRRPEKGSVLTASCGLAPAKAPPRKWTTPFGGFRCPAGEGTTTQLPATCTAAAGSREETTRALIQLEEWREKLDAGAVLARTTSA